MPTLNPTQRFVAFSVGGQDYKLSFDFNSIIKCEQVCGVNLFSAIGLNNNTAAQWRGLVWAALLAAQPKSTLDDASAIMQAAVTEPGKLEELFSAINQTLGASMPEPDPQQPDQAAI